VPLTFFALLVGNSLGAEFGIGITSSLVLQPLNTLAARAQHKSLQIFSTICGSPVNPIQCAVELVAGWRVFKVRCRSKEMFDRPTWLKRKYTTGNQYWMGPSSGAGR